MQESLVVSSRGQITLPAVLRKCVGIKSGDVLILEDRGNKIVLKPGVVIEVDCYSDKQIAEWDTADVLSDRGRTRIIGRFSRSE